MDCDDVTHEEIIKPHCQLTKAACAAGSTWLILCETTEIDFKRDARGLGPVGQGTGRGFFLQTGIMRDANSAAISGMAGQVLFHRQPKPKKPKPKKPRPKKPRPKKPRPKKTVPKNTKRRAANRESLAWGQLIDQIGQPPGGVKWLHVCDRGADDDEVFCRAFLNECGWVVRAARLNRKVSGLSGETLSFEE